MSWKEPTRRIIRPASVTLRLTTGNTLPNHTILTDGAKFQLVRGAFGYAIFDGGLQTIQGLCHINFRVLCGVENR